MTLAIWNSVAVWIEYWLLTSVYKGIPALAESSRRKISRFLPNDLEERSSLSGETVQLLPQNEESSALEDKEWRRKFTEWVSKAPFVGAWIVYLRQDVVLPGVALALLYFTVLR